MPLEPAETRPRSNFPESRESFSKVRLAKLNTDVTISMPGTDYFGETALKQHITYLSTSCGNHTITHFRGTDKAMSSEFVMFKTSSTPKRLAQFQLFEKLTRAN